MAGRGGRWTGSLHRERMIGGDSSATSGGSSTARDDDGRAPTDEKQTDGGDDGRAAATEEAEEDEEEDVVAAADGVENVRLCPMAVADAVFLYVDFAVAACVELEAGGPRLTHPELYKLVRAASRGHAVLRARAVRIGRRAYWQPELYFRPSRHLVLLHTASSSGVDDEIAREAGTPLPFDRPLWRVTYICAADASRHCLLLTIHHCVGDGAFIASAMLRPLLGAVPPTPPATRRRQKLLNVSSGAPTSASSLRGGGSGDGSGGDGAGGVGVLTSISWVCFLPVALALQAYALLTSNPMSPDPHSALGLASSSSILISGESDIGRIRAATGASVTDIVLCALTARLREMLASRRRQGSEARAGVRGGGLSAGAPEHESGVEPSSPLLAFVPVMAGKPPDMATALREHEGNAVSGFFVALPVHLDSPAARLRRIQTQTYLAKRSHVAIALGRLVRLGLGLLPRQLMPALVPLLAEMRGCCGVSSLRGPAHASCGGASVEALYFWALPTGPDASHGRRGLCGRPAAHHARAQAGGGRSLGA